MEWREDRIAAAERGENPTVMTRMRTGWAVIGDTQHLPGYCLLLYAGKADHLTDLGLAERVAFLTDMALLGQAVEAAISATDPAFRRINYEILGNSFHHLHAHIHARYEWEPPQYRNGPVWRYDTARTEDVHRLDERDAPLRQAITTRLAAIMVENYVVPND
jgi:diadenosine tetraphosphate (Ap4A) HIT family hydrolase